MTTTNDDSGLEPVIRTGDEPPQAFVQIRKPPKKTTWPWLVAAMVFIVVVSAVAGAGADWRGGDGGVANALAYGLGYSIIPALLLGFAVYLVLYQAVLKRSNRDNGGRYLAVLVITALLSGMTMSVVVHHVQGPPLDRDAVAAAFEALDAEQEATRTRLETELADADPDIFAPAALKRRGGYDRASAELERRRALIAEAITVNEAMAARMRRSMEAAIRNPSRRRQFMAAFDAGYGGRRTEVMAFWGGQRHILDLTQAQLDFLRETRWSAQGGRYMFHRQSDYDAFGQRQAEIARLTEAAARELERLDRNREESRRKVDAELSLLAG